MANSNGRGPFLQGKRCRCINNIQHFCCVTCDNLLSREEAADGAQDPGHGEALL